MYILYTYKISITLTYLYLLLVMVSIVRFVAATFSFFLHNYKFTVIILYVMYGDKM